MISKPLFKQSCKANAGIWTFVTTITCFMLAIIICVLGNLNVNEIRNSMTDMFVSDAIESTIESQSMTYFNLTDKALNNYENNYNSMVNIINAYQGLIASGKTDVEARAMIAYGKTEAETTAINNTIDFYLAQGSDYSTTAVSNYVLNAIADNIYDQIKTEQGEETANQAKQFITTAIDSYIQTKQASSDVDVTEYATSYIPNVMQELFYGQSIDYEGRTIEVSTYFTKESINEKSYTAIVTFRAQVSVKENQIKELNPTYTDEQINAEVEAYKATIISENSKALVDELPQKVCDALGEIKDMDVYGLVIGSIFFRIAGLLLPMIFVIMTANNLIAGQVDSGSMAYVLSTPTKRRTVTLTQICYLVTSLFVMFAMTTLTSVVCLAIVNSSEITIGYGEILLLNLGAFITMLAVSGICFLASSWFNRSKMSMSCGGGLTMFFLVATILGLFGSDVIPSAIRIDAMKCFNYVSIISLFDATSIISGNLCYLWKFAILLVIAIVTYTIGVIKFDKKDLPL